MVTDIPAHLEDGSDPHGATLTQTNLLLVSGSVTGDVTVSGSAYIPNVVFGTDATPPEASNYPEGTLYFQYTEA